jgi:hypothetical protein
MRDGYRHKMEGKFINLKAPHRRGNRHIVGFEAPLYERRFVNRASCAGCTNGSAFQKKVHRDMTATQ